MPKFELNASNAAEVCGVSLQAFARWKLKPARKQGREVFYCWDDVKKMRDLKRSLRTRPESCDLDGELTSVRKLALSIGDDAQRALEEGDLDQLATQLARMQALAKAAGIDVTELGAEVQ